MVNRKLLIFGGAGGIGGFYLYHKHRKAMLDASTAPVTDPSIDPNTGLPYASEDPSAYGQYSPAYATTGGGTGATAIDPSTGLPVGAVPPAPVVPPEAPPWDKATTNAEWVQRAGAYLVQQGYDPVSVAGALGKYVTLVGRPLTTTEMNIVEAAIGAMGPPPVGNIPPPTLAAAPAQQPKAVPDGYYQDIVTGEHWQVTGGKRWHIYYATALKMKGVKWTPILSNNPVMKLPYGGSL